MTTVDLLRLDQVTQPLDRAATRDRSPADARQTHDFAMDDLEIDRARKPDRLVEP